MNNKDLTQPLGKEMPGVRLRIMPTLITATTLAQTLVGVNGLHAQTAENERTEGADNLELEEVVLQSSKNEPLKLSSPRFTAPLLDTPQTVNVISSEVMQQQGAISLQDVLRNSPGITFRAGEGGAPSGDNLFIRGFSATNDVFVDGVRSIGEQSRDAYNLEQVEVTKGPSSSYAGRGSAGGSINLVTKSPKLENASGVTAAVGTDNFLRGTFDTNQVVSEKHGVAVRIVGMATESDKPGRDVVENSSWAINPTISYGLGTDTRLTLGYEHFEEDSIPDYGMPTDAFEMGIDRSNFYGFKDRDFSDVRSDRVKFDAVHDFNENYTLRNTTAFNRTETRITATATGGITGNLVHVDDKNRHRIVENYTNQTSLSGTFNTGSLKHSFIAGLDLSKEKFTSYDLTASTYTPGGTAADKDLGNPDGSGVLSSGGGKHTGDYTEVKSETVAVFLGDTIELNERWELNGSVRLENYDVRQKDTSDPASDGIHLDDTLFSWRTGVVFKPVENGSIYFGVGNSLTPASAASGDGFSLTTREGRTSNPETDPLETTAYELGTKWDFYDARLSVSAAFFYTELENDWTTDPVTLESVQIGKNITQGFELGVSGQITDKWFVYSGFTVLDSEVEDLGADDGNELAFVPEITFNFWSTYALTEKLTVGVGVIYSGEQSYSEDGSEAPDDAEYVLVNAMASYQMSDSLSLQLNIDNLTDEDYIERGSGRRSVPGPTRSAKLSINYRF